MIFWLDCRVNDGSELRPYFMPKGLMSFVANADYDLSSGHMAKRDESTPLRAMT